MAVGLSWGCYHGCHLQTQWSHTQSHDRNSTFPGLFGLTKVKCALHWSHPLLFSCHCSQNKEHLRFSHFWCTSFFIQLLPWLDGICKWTKASTYNSTSALGLKVFQDGGVIRWLGLFSDKTRTHLPPSPRRNPRDKQSAPLFSWKGHLAVSTYPLLLQPCPCLGLNLSEKSLLFHPCQLQLLFSRSIYQSCWESCQVQVFLWCGDFMLSHLGLTPAS